MLRGDIEVVARIAQAVFPVPWRPEDFAQEFEREHAHVRVLRPGRGQPISAFVNYWVVASELQVMNVATLPSVRRRGFARLLLLDAMDRGRALGLREASLEVRRSSEAALGLYEGLGFERVGLRQAYYSDNGEDAVVMRCDLADASSLW